jgi:hypothetical protein
VSEDDIKFAFSMVKTMVRKGSLQNLKQVVEKFIDRIVISDEGILIKFHFSKERKTPPPDPYRDLPLREQIHITTLKRSGERYNEPPQIYQNFIESESIKAEKEKARLYAVDSATHRDGIEGS